MSQAETNKQAPAVVQAQVVQGAVPAEVVQAQVVGQPAMVIGQPAGMPGGMVYQPVQASPDQQSAQQAWLLYGVGCFLCWCMGPCGLCVWYTAACMHFCKPEEQRRQLPQTGQAACVSLVTAIISTVLIGVLIILYVALVATAVSNPDSYYYPDSYYNNKGSSSHDFGSHER